MSLNNLTNSVEVLVISRLVFVIISGTCIEYG